MSFAEIICKEISRVQRIKNTTTVAETTGIVCSRNGHLLKHVTKIGEGGYLRCREVSNIFDTFRFQERYSKVISKPFFINEWMEGDAVVAQALSAVCNRIRKRS